MSSRPRRAQRPIRLLVVNQRMDRTGAPMQLASLLPGLADALGARITMLTGPAGPLTAAVAPHVWRVRREPWPLRGLARITRSSSRPIARLLDRAWLVAMRRLVGPVDLVYVNSLVSARLARPFAERPTVVHVHELGGVAESFGARARDLARGAERVLVPSLPAVEWVVSCGVPETLVEVLPGAVPPGAFDVPPTEAVEELRARLGITAADAVVSTVGWVGPLKGSDRFAAVAAAVAPRTHRPVRFVWVGAGAGTGEEQRFRADLAALDLGDIVSVVPGLDDLRPLYVLTDVQLVASREESLSMVALEAAAQGTPVVCFPGAGGPDALAEEGVVTLASSADADRVADLLVDLLADGEDRAARGARARELVAAHHGVEAAQRQLVGALASVTGRAGG